MIKMTVLYGHPADPAAFENYYVDTHTPLALTMKGVSRMELTKFLKTPDGADAAFYRMAELYFTGVAEMQKAMDSPEGKATGADLANFATGGVTFLVGAVD